MDSGPEMVTIEVPRTRFDPAEMDMLAHIYSGEVNRSTSGAPGSTGPCLVTHVSGPVALALPLILIGLLYTGFLSFEGPEVSLFQRLARPLSVAGNRCLRASAARRGRQDGWEVEHAACP